MSDKTPAAEVMLKMRSFEFIHASEDVPRILRFASELGLIIRHDRCTEIPQPDIIGEKKMDYCTDGVFILHRLEWIFGDLKFDVITDGPNKGKYFQNPATNYVGISLYAAGERSDGSFIRLGGGSLTRDINWYRPSDHSVQAAPLDVKTVFDTIRKYSDTGRRLRGGVHNYAILKSAWDKLTEGNALPPFDYIELPPATKKKR